MKRKVLAMIIALTMSVSLCACGGVNETASGSNRPADNWEENVKDLIGDVELPSSAAQDSSAPQEKPEDEPQGEIHESQNGSNESGGEAPVKPEDEPQIDLSELLTTYELEYTDNDGYQIKESIELSRIYHESEIEELIPIWEAMGGRGTEIPVGDAAFTWDAAMASDRRTYSFTGVQYIVGTRTIKNMTKGFSFSASNSHVCPLFIVPEKIDEAEQNEEFAYVTHSGGVLLFYASPTGMTTEAHKTRYSYWELGRALMKSDKWGPIRFLIILPDKVTPNNPTGFDYTNNIKYTLSPGIAPSRGSDLEREKMLTFTLPN